MHTKQNVQGETYLLEAWLASAGDIYKFGVQVIPRKSSPHSFSIRLSEEFIEDEIDNKKNPEYLERVTLRVVCNHIEDLLKLTPHAVVGNLKWWFKEAKRQIGEVKEEVK